MPDSDWGEDSDSGSIHDPDNYPLSTVPETPSYDVGWVDADPSNDFGMGTIPFVIDYGARKIFLAPEGCMHAQIVEAAPEIIGPIGRGYITRGSGEIRIAGEGRDSELIEKILEPYVNPTSPEMRSRMQSFGSNDEQECRHCGELLADCECLAWGEGADWADEPIDQSTIMEMRPAIQSRLTQAQKAAAWDKPDKDLTPAEREYVNRSNGDDVQRRTAHTCRCPRCELARAA